LIHTALFSGAVFSLSDGFFSIRFRPTHWIAQLNTITFDVLYHIGTMNPADKLKNFLASHEGHGLSVSQYPDAWREIARLGGHPLWRLTRPGNVFFDYHQLEADGIGEIEEWGLANGWIRQKQVWVGEYYDDEAEGTRVIYESTKKKLKEELESIADPDDETVSMEKRVVPTTTAQLNAYHGFEVDDMSVPHLLAVAYVEHVLNLDGVFWDDILDPVGLSAPRAVILPERLAAWTIEPATESEWFYEPGDESDE
jgi:hypothetical protein